MVADEEIIACVIVFILVAVIVQIIDHTGLVVGGRDPTGGPQCHMPIKRPSGKLTLRWETLSRRGQHTALSDCCCSDPPLDPGQKQTDTLARARMRRPSSVRGCC